MQSKSNAELIRSIIVLRLCDNKFLIQRNQAVFNALQKLAGQNLFKIFLKATMFAHFVAGENLDEVEIYEY